MKYNKILVVTLFIVFILFNLQNYKIENFKKQNNFKLVVTFYNPGKYFLEKCLTSIENQNYKNYQLCLLNDTSTKEVNELDTISEKYCKRNNWIYFKNTVNKGPCYSRIKATELLNPKDEDIIVLIDGDDKLNNSNVLNILNDKYQDNTLITFGNFVKVNSKGETKSDGRVKCHKLNIPQIVKHKKFRNLPGNKYPFSHLKTFKYKLYKKLDLEDLKKDGEYIKSATDAALMYPLEMAGKNIKCVKEILYDYTIDHSESFHNNTYRKIKQTENLRYVQGLKKYDSIDFEQNNSSVKNNKLFFIHIPKNAGTSIENVMKEKFNFNWGRFYNFSKSPESIEINNNSVWHIPPKYLKNNNPYKNKILLAVVRNPYERVVSKFKYDCKQSEEPIEINRENLNNFVSNIPYIIQENKFFNGCHYLPQYEYIDYKSALKFEIIRFENIESDLNKILQKYNLKKVKLDYYNSSGNKVSVDGFR